MLALLLMTLPGVAMAHKMDPLLLEIRAQDDLYEVTWNLPVELSRRTPKPTPKFPAHCKENDARPCISAPERQCRSYLLACDPFALGGHLISFEHMDGLSNSVIVEFEHGQRYTTIAGESEHSITLPQNQQKGWVMVLSNYLLLGVQHILQGVDHLLFVLGLLLLVVGTGRLVLTVTAFTVGHSITLGAAALGWVSAPATAIEALIALSVLLLAVELTHNRETLTKRVPWFVAGGFGLLHGFGFAGVLTELGLGQAHIPMALLGFNLGVEVGQLAFIIVFFALAQIRFLDLRDCPRFAAYLIGVPAAAWSMERLMAWGALF
jgi:hypothetical protein